MPWIRRPGRTLWFERGGSDGPTVLFLHGLGATAEVWRQMLEAADPTWGGRWVIADLAGHGRSDPALEYSFEGHAADVADLVQDGSPLTAVGHSMGAVVGLALASGRFGVTVGRTVGIGIKVAWTEEELARVAELAAKPSKWFESREEAEAFFLRVAGLQGLATPGDAVAASGVREEGGRFRLAADPATASVGAPPMAGLVAAAKGSVRLACGEHDALVAVDQLREFDPGAVELKGLGHNAHVEDPTRVRDLIASTAAGRTPGSGNVSRPR